MSNPSIESFWPTCHVDTRIVNAIGLLKGFLDGFMHARVGNRIHLETLLDRMSQIIGHYHCQIRVTIYMHFL